ncbi:MAG: DUF4173 domain-containing protein [Cytophagales bacterium]|nr:MAG: DUF4173 domain-containing protein [Cytophagales bacterium]
MQGIILHYDSLTGCGLLRPEEGSPVLFRQNQLIDARTVSAEQRVTFSGAGEGLNIVTKTRSEAIPDQYEDLLDAELKRPEPVTYLEAKPVQPQFTQTTYTSPTTYETPAQPARMGFYNWPGTLVAVAAFGLLLAAGQGNKPSNRFDKNLPLINSIWGMCAAALLAMTTYWQAVGMSRGRVRSAVWGVAICSIMAYLLQGCQGFEADGAAQWYIYAMIVLFLIVYILPYRVRF